MTSATIDGQHVAPGDDETILAAAQRLGIEIPHLCLVEGLAPEGGCRMCIVECAGAARPLAACHTRLVPGMQVRTRTQRLVNVRKELLRLLVEHDPTGALAACDARTPFGRLLDEHGLRQPSVRPRGDLDPAHPYLRLDPALCILCRACVHACEDIQGQFVYGIGGRGAATRLLVGARDRYTDSGCTACGACVDRCPTGAILDHDRLAPPPDQLTQSVCGYCGTGCRIEVGTRGAEVVAVRGVAEAAVNRGHLCAKGRYAHAWHSAPARLVRPLRRDGERWTEIGWPEAIAWAAERLRSLRQAHGGDALACLTSSRSTNEAAYLLQKLFRTVFATNHVDCCARVCHSSSALALGRALGTSAASASFVDLERARRIVVAGANPTEAHPVVGARIKEAVLRGTALLVVDPRRTELADHAQLHLQLRPGTNVLLFHGIAKVLCEEGSYDVEYVRERTEGFERLRALLAELSLVEVARVTGVPEGDVRAAARLLGAGPTLFVHGLGLSEQAQGVAAVETLCNLGMLTGSIGKLGAGMLPLRGQNNVQGNADMGSMPDALTGYQRLDDPEVRERVRALWGVAPPPTPGWTIPEMLQAARDRRLRGLWIQGEDPAQSDPDQTRVVEALARLDFLVVQEMFLSETARLAHLVLPAAGCLEQDGTFTNAERRIQRVRAAVPPPGEARADWEVLVDLATALGQTWSYRGPSEVMDEIARVAPALFGGVAYARLEGDGLQWPCPDADHPGTATIHERSFVRGHGRFCSTPYVPAPEHAVPGYPYTLITGRVLHHYNVGTMTRSTPQQRLAPEDWLDMHPEDARNAGFSAGQAVRIESRWGETEARVRLTPRMALGTLFLSFHQPATHANRLVGPHHDPESKCPDYKTVAVRLGR